jgi:beta-mannosidase
LSISPGVLLNDGWRLTLTQANACATPADIPAGLESIAAFVPGTVAQALEAAGQFDRSNPRPLNTLDAWYRLTLAAGTSGAARLHFAGLATISEVYLNGHLLFTSHSMYESHDADLMLSGADELAICFRALAPHLEKTGPRARWRPQMMSAQGLRLIRTTTLGYMPGWCPDIHAAGPWRPVSLTTQSEPVISELSISAELTDDGDGILTVSFHLPGDTRHLDITCAGQQGSLRRADDGRYCAKLLLPAIEQWWPHTHGKPQLHDISLLIDGKSHRLGRTGFRRIDVDRGADGTGFGLRINGQPIFCRGAVWTSADIVNLPGNRSDYEPWLNLAADAGMNMIRIGGTMTYESPDFFALCDELGLMVWQDLMFANFDYPVKDEEFCAHVGVEVKQFLAGVDASPSLAVLCGGSEMHQQSAMLGLPERMWKGPLTQEILAELAAQLRPDVPYVENSPCGGALPFFPNAGVAHYYGVGAYCRPLEDARRAHVHFAAECLAFANVPQQSTLERHLPVQPVHDPRWKARVPRDRGASWDFEDVRDHYLGLLYDADPARLRREDGEHYLDLSRAVTGEVMEATFAEWRRDASPCNGALVWTLQDLLPGPGWGIIDATGEPKPAWYALKRAFRPLQLLLSDEGTNGLDAHVINETAETIELVLELTCLRDGAQAVVSGKREMTLGPRQTITIAATDLFGAFFDTTYAYRFGPPSHDVTIARLRNKQTGSVLAEAFHFPLGRAKALHAASIAASVICEDGQWFVDLTADRFAQSVHIYVEDYRTSDDWFHLTPGETKRVKLTAKNRDAAPPSGDIRSLGAKQIFRF